MLCLTWCEVFLATVKSSTGRAMCTGKPWEQHGYSSRINLLSPLPLAFPVLGELGLFLTAPKQSHIHYGTTCELMRAVLGHDNNPDNEAHPGVPGRFFLPLFSSALSDCRWTNCAILMLADAGFWDGVWLEKPMERGTELSSAELCRDTCFFPSRERLKDVSSLRRSKLRHLQH